MGSKKDPIHGVTILRQAGEITIKPNGDKYILAHDVVYLDPRWVKKFVRELNGEKVKFGKY